MSIAANNMVWRAELTIGTRHGYKGPNIVTPWVLHEQVQAFQEGQNRWFAIIVWGNGTVIGPNFPVEEVYKISLENNPLYTPDAAEEEVTQYAVQLAEHLATKLHQVRIYCAVYPVRSLIVEQTP